VGAELSTFDLELYLCCQFEHRWGAAFVSAAFFFKRCRAPELCL
jgi:hypothetical protein